MKEENIFPIIKNLLKTAHVNHSIKEDLFQDLYLYHLQLEKRYISSMNVPLEAFLVKFLQWKMWALIKNEYSTITNIVENLPDYREEEEEVDLSPLLRGTIEISESEASLLILRHIGKKSYIELSQYSGLSIEGIRKKLNKIERSIKWEGINKKIMRKEE